MAVDKAAYSREYQRKNKERLRVYKRDWMRTSREKASYKHISVYLRKYKPLLIEQRRKNIENRKLQKLERKQNRELKVVRKTLLSVLRGFKRLKLRQEMPEKTRLREYNNYHNNPKRKMGLLLRTRLNTALREGRGVGSAVQRLGCTLDEFKVHIESQFQPGMSWENWSMRGWHLDHIRPLDSFDLTKPEELAKACHYSNMQPLWAKENWSKGARIDHLSPTFIKTE